MGPFTGLFLITRVRVLRASISTEDAVLSALAVHAPNAGLEIPKVAARKVVEHLASQTTTATVLRSRVAQSHEASD